MKHGIKTIAGAVTAAIFAVFAFGCAPTGIWRIKQITDVVSLHTELQKDYLADGYNNIAEYANGVEELSRPAPVLLEWEYENANAKKYVLEVSRYENFVKPIKIATAEPRAEVSSFTTAAAAPRNLYVDGVTNVRDLGGWSTWDGQTVKQGMIIRCGRLNKSETPEVEIEITDDGIAFMRDVLDVATEIDLRMPDAHNTETGG
ncbi:MAG: tyrosine-protein phosphatase, partial [Clostridia bacterium]|nr:tyrosine-protein phosphatase [Clostridia bacterium]